MAAPHLHRLAAPGPLLARLAHGAVQTIFARALHLVRPDPPRTTLRLREAVARRGLAPSRPLLHASTRGGRRAPRARRAPAPRPPLPPPPPPPPPARRAARRARLEGRRTPVARGRRAAH